jgi:hypothetical protein
MNFPGFQIKSTTLFYLSSKEFTGDPLKLLHQILDENDELSLSERSFLDRQEVKKLIQEEGEILLDFTGFLNSKILQKNNLKIQLSAIT